MALPRGLANDNRGGESGFSLIEVVMVVALVLAVFVWGLAVTFDFYAQVEFYGERDALAGILRRARSRALTNLRESDHGLYIASSSYIVFQGSSYAARSSTFDEFFARDTNITLVGPSELVFEALSGDGIATGTLTMSSGVRNATITVNGTGQIDW